MTDTYITIEEAADITGFTLAQVERKLETGEWPAAIMAELESATGESRGFDIALLPPEAVRHVLAESSYVIEFPWCGGIGKARAKSDKNNLRVLVGEADNPFIPIKNDGKADAGASPALPKQRFQEKRILELLELQNIDPLKLPPRLKGQKPGIKAAIIKIALTEKPLIFSKNSFDKAWQRMRDDGSIGEGT